MEDLSNEPQPSKVSARKAVVVGALAVSGVAGALAHFSFSERNEALISIEQDTGEPKVSSPRIENASEFIEAVSSFNEAKIKDMLILIDIVEGLSQEEKKQYRELLQGEPCADQQRFIENFEVLLDSYNFESKMKLLQSARDAESQKIQKNY